MKIACEIQGLSRYVPAPCQEYLAEIDAHLHGYEIPADFHFVPVDHCVLTDAVWAVSFFYAGAGPYLKSQVCSQAS